MLRLGLHLCLDALRKAAGESFATPSRDGLIFEILADNAGGINDYPVHLENTGSAGSAANPDQTPYPALRMKLVTGPNGHLALSSEGGEKYYDGNMTNFEEGHQDVTLMAVLKWSEPAGYLFRWGNYNTGQCIMFPGEIYDQLTFAQYANDVSGPTTPKDRWLVVSAVKSGQLVNMFVNGFIVRSANASDTSNYQGTTLCIGRLQGFAGFGFNGEFTSMRLFDRALSAEQHTAWIHSLAVEAGIPYAEIPNNVALYARDIIFNVQWSVVDDSGIGFNVYINDHDDFGSSSKYNDSPLSGDNANVDIGMYGPGQGYLLYVWVTSIKNGVESYPSKSANAYLIPELTSWSTMGLSDCVYVGHETDPGLYAQVFSNGVSVNIDEDNNGFTNVYSDLFVDIAVSVRQCKDIVAGSPLQWGPTSSPQTVYRTYGPINGILAETPSPDDFVLNPNYNTGWKNLFWGSDGVIPVGTTVTLGEGGGATYTYSSYVSDPEAGTTEYNWLDYQGNIANNIFISAGTHIAISSYSYWNGKPPGY